MKQTRDLWHKTIRVGKLELHTTNEFYHSLLTTDELALIASLAAQAAQDALERILEAK